MKKFFHEFKEFAFKGNAFDLAIGVIIGAAFQGIVKSLVDDLISPILGLFLQQNFSDLSLHFLGVTVNYGSFITALINFILMTLVIFLLVKGLNALKSLGKKEEAAVEAVTTKICPFCRSEIDVAATRCPHCTSEQPAE